MQCIIHGDAKEANVLFSSSSSSSEPTACTATNGRRPDVDLVVTLCDFQYCGKGPPSKDLAYFLCSSANPDDEKAALEFYLRKLSERLASATDDIPMPSMDDLQDSMDLAYCDFYRFSKCISSHGTVFSTFDCRPYYCLISPTFLTFSISSL
jgi:thiamine kinase-like enzyme